jgi:hypothetical protein
VVNENASLIKYEPPKCDECGRKIVVLSDLCAKCAAGIELNGKEQANRPGTNPLPTWPKPPAAPNPPPAPTNLLGLLKGAFDWIESAPHGDNCFVSDHYEGDPGNRCNCGKDSLLSAYEEFGQPEAPAVAVNEDLGKAIHYPECWDVAAYPTVAHAISELTTCFQCGECVKSSAVAVNEQMLDVLKFIQRGMERNHIKAKPFLDFSNPNAESLELQHPLTLVNAAIAAAEAAKGGVHVPD